MEIWHLWTQTIVTALGLATSHFGLSEAVGIILVTLAVRLAMLPLSLSSAYKGQKNTAALERVKPQIEQLRERLNSDPAELAKQTMAIYRSNEIHFFDKTTVTNLGAQSIVGLGFFQALKSMSFNSKFLWIANIGKADILLSIVVGVLMFASMSLAPGTAEQTSMLFLVIPVLISVFALISFPSAIGLYWATSNLVTVFQSLALRWLSSRQTRLHA